MENVTDSELSRRETLARLVAQYERAVLNTCCMILHDHGLAEDVTQETFLKAYRALDRYRQECSEKTWLMKIALNACRDVQRSAWFRHTDRCVALEELPIAVQDADFAEAEDLLRAVRQLPGKFREVILLHYYQDMTMAEVAFALGISVSTVSKRIRQGCRCLETLLGKEWDA